MPWNGSCGHCGFTGWSTAAEVLAALLVSPTESAVSEWLPARRFDRTNVAVDPLREALPTAAPLSKNVTGPASGPAITVAESVIG